MTRARQMIVAASVFFSVNAGIHYYLYLRLVRDTALASPVGEAAAAALLLLALSIPATFFFMRAVSFNTFRIISSVPYTWLGMMMLLVFGFVFVDLLRALFFLGEKIFGLDISPSLFDGTFTRERARAGAVLGVTVLLTVVSIYRASRVPIVKRVEIALSRFPRNLDGFKIVQISDIHIGGGGTGRRLEQLTAQVNNLKPDLIAITGDLVDGALENLKDEIASIKDLRAPHGVYFVTGNHEYYSGALQWVAEIKRLGIRVLRNEAVAIGKGDQAFYLAGVDDYASKGMAPGHGQDIPKAVRGIPTDKAVVLLAHQPKAAEEASSLGVDLMLSGHTHGGQIWPFSYLVSLQQPYNKGFHRLGTLQIYVNQGTFVWGPPMRLGSFGEISEIVLSRAP